MTFEDFYRNELQPFEQFMYKKMNEPDDENIKIKDAMLYSLQAGGKRLRPMITLMTLHMFGEEVQRGYLAALAVELLHTYSLIHDDLPAMDDDDLRRGMPSNHKKFGEATAILAGDGLLTKAFDVLSQELEDPLKTVKLIQLLAHSAGNSGMIAGQQEDMDGETKKATLEELRSIHEKKTGALLTYSFLAGAILADADEKMLGLLKSISEYLGIAYQIRDDLLDVIGTEEQIGKPVGSDVEKEKSTYPSLLGLEDSKKLLLEELNQAKEHVEKLNAYCRQKGRMCEDGVLLSFIHSLDLEEEQ